MRTALRQLLGSREGPPGPWPPEAVTGAVPIHERPRPLRMYFVRREKELDEQWAELPHQLPVLEKRVRLLLLPQGEVRETAHVASLSLREVPPPNE